MVNLEKDCLNQLKQQEKIARDDEKTIREVLGNDNDYLGYF